MSEHVQAAASIRAASQSAETPHPAVLFLSSISKHLVVLVPLAMALGLAAGLVVDMAPLKPAVLPLTMLMVYPMLVNFRVADTLNLRDGRAVGIAMALDFVALPLVAWGIAWLFFRDQPGLFVGTVLAGLFPTSGMTISWTGFAKGNVAAAVKMTVIGLIAASLLAPAYLLAFAGKVVPVDFQEVLKTVLFVVGVPMLAGILTRRVLVSRFGRQRYKQRVAPIFPGLSTVGVLAIVFLAIGLKAEMIVNDPALLGRILVPLAIFYAVNFAGSTLVGRALLPRADAIAVVYGTVMRNLSIALGIAMASFGPEAALVLAAAYIVQVQSAAWYVRLSDRIFGPAEDAAPAVALARDTA